VPAGERAKCRFIAAGNAGHERFITLLVHC
jgi:hypothetical protein